MITLGRLVLLAAPGVLVLVADAPTGSWSRPVLLPVAVLPALLLVQQTAARLGSVTGQRHGELLRRRLGPAGAGLAAVALLGCGLAALVVELAGVADAGGLVGLPRWLSVGVPALALAGLALTGGYRRAAAVGVVLGLVELLFILVATLARPVVSGSGGDVPLVLADLAVTALVWVLYCREGPTGTASAPIAPMLARDAAVILFGLAIAGTALVLTLLGAVVSGWTAERCRAVVVGGLAVAAVAVGVVPGTATLALGCGLVAAVLAPLLLGGLLVVEHRALPVALRGRGARHVATLVLTGAVVAVGLAVAASVI